MDEIIHDTQSNQLLVNGVFLPMGAPRVTANEIIEQLRSVLSTKYSGDDLSKAQMTKSEAALLALAERAQEGDLEAIKYLHDRLIGKPVQSTINVSATTDLKSFLATLAGENTPASAVVDIIPDPRSVFDD